MSESADARLETWIPLPNLSLIISAATWVGHVRPCQIFAILYSISATAIYPDRDKNGKSTAGSSCRFWGRKRTDAYLRIYIPLAHKELQHWPTRRPTILMLSRHKHRMARHVRSCMGIRMSHDIWTALKCPSHCAEISNEKDWAN